MFRCAAQGRNLELVGFGLELRFRIEEVSREVLKEPASASFLEIPGLNRNLGSLWTGEEQFNFRRET